MMRHADTIGVFQIESAPRCRCCRAETRAFYDLVIEIAIVRPGRSRATWCTHICGGVPARTR